MRKVDKSKCLLPNYNQCCCTCKNHYEDLTHCATTPKKQMYDENGKYKGCNCFKHKGWICMKEVFNDRTQETAIMAHSGWTEHGLCELYIPKEK